MATVKHAASLTLPLEPANRQALQPRTDVERVTQQLISVLQALCRCIGDLPCNCQMSHFCVNVAKATRGTQGGSAKMSHIFFLLYVSFVNITFKSPALSV